MLGPLSCCLYLPHDAVQPTVVALCPYVSLTKSPQETVRTCVSTNVPTTGPTTGPTNASMNIPTIASTNVPTTHGASAAGSCNRLVSPRMAATGRARLLVAIARSDPGIPRFPLGCLSPEAAPHGCGCGNASIGPTGCLAGSCLRGSRIGRGALVGSWPIGNTGNDVRRGRGSCSSWPG